MFLSVDVGNTQTTLGLFDSMGVVVRQWRMATDTTDTADELHERLYGYFQMFGLTLSSVTDVALASVVPILTATWSHMLTHAVAPPLVVDASRDCGITVAMPPAVSVGADRIANALAARTTYGAPVIVVDFGTATNIDVVDARGAFRGGAIMPGILASANALFAHAAKLASVPLVAPPSALGNTTETAVQSGIVIGAAAMAEGLVARIARELAAEAAAETQWTRDVQFAESQIKRAQRETGRLQGQTDHRSRNAVRGVSSFESEGGRVGTQQGRANNRNGAWVGVGSVSPWPTVVGTGGFSSTVAAATNLFDAIDPDLTIRGIYQIWQHARDKHARRAE